MHASKSYFYEILSILYTSVQRTFEIYVYKETLYKSKLLYIVDMCIHYIDYLLRIQDNSL